MLTQLKQLGLSDKEAKVYLASLELGETAVQQIAKKAGVNRPTAYVEIENLIKMGLMSSVEKGKKRYFAASSPGQLSRLLDKEKSEIEKKTEDFSKIMPELEEIFELGQIKEKPRVRFFEGKEGIKAIREDILETKTDDTKEFVPLDDSYKFFPPLPEDHRVRIAKKLKKIPGKTIYTSNEGPILSAKEDLIERRFIPSEKFPFHTQITIYGDKIALVSLKDRLVGVIIENQGITESMKSIFNLAWEAAEKYQK